jgi:hypothetical protein
LLLLLTHHLIALALLRRLLALGLLAHHS